MGRKKVFALALMLFNIQVLSASSKLRSLNIPITTKEIHFELEVTDSLKVEPVYLDFGNILKNSNTLQTKSSYFYFDSSFSGDMLVSTNYLDGIDEGNYKKYSVYKKGEITGDSLEVFLLKTELQILKKGENKIPIIGEIREVGNVALGNYEKTIKMDVIVQPVSPL